MPQARSTVEEDVDSSGLVLSMRAKMCLAGLCFFLVLGSIVCWSVPNAVQALRGLAQGGSLAENENTPSDQETPGQLLHEDWPMLGGNPGRTGHSESQAPRANSTAWTYQIDGWMGSPVVSGGMVFVVVGPTRQPCRICAFDQFSGELLWSKEMTGYTSYGSFSCAVADGIVFVAKDWFGDSLYAYNQSTGEMVWNRAYDRVTFCPVVSDGLLLTGGDRICAYDLTGELVWIYRTPPNEEVPYYGSRTDTPAAAGGVVYGFNPWSGPAAGIPLVEGNHVKGSVFALNQSTGERLWTYQTGWTGSSSRLAGGGYPVVADGMVIVNADDGLYVLNSTTGELVWRTLRGSYGAGIDVAHVVELIFETPPAVADGTIFALVHHWGPLRFVAMNLSTGEFIWETEVGGMPDIPTGVGSPAVADGLVFTGTGGNGFFAIDELTGDIEWRHKTQALEYSSPAVADGMVFVGTNDGMLYAFADIREAGYFPMLPILGFVLLPALLRRQSAL